MKEYDTFMAAAGSCAGGGGGGWYWLHSGNPDALRQIVLQQCVPNQQQHKLPRRVPTLICRAATCCLKIVTDPCSIC